MFPITLNLIVYVLSRPI